MPFGMVSGVGRGMGVLDGVVIVEGERAVLGLNVGRPIVTNGDFATRLFPNYFGQYLFKLMKSSVMWNVRKLLCAFDFSRHKLVQETFNFQPLCPKIYF